MTVTEPSTEPSEAEAAATVVTVIDAEGNKHWSSRDSSFVVKGIADGSLQYADEEAEPVAAAEPTPASTAAVTVLAAGQQRTQAARQQQDKPATDAGGQASNDASIS